MRGEAVADESQALQKKCTRITEEKHNGKRGLVAGMKVIGQVLLPRETVHCPLYSEKEGLCGVETYPYFQRIEDTG